MNEVKLLNTKKAAEYLGLSEHYLLNLRGYNDGPEFIKRGFFVFYTTPDLDLWKQEREKRFPPGALRPNAAAKFLGLSLDHLKVLRRLGRGPAFHTVGSRFVYYTTEELNEWKANRYRTRRET